MKGNTFLVCLGILGILLSINCTATPAEPEQLLGKEQPHIQFSITTNLDTVTSVFQVIIITVTMKNLENESVSLDIGGYPGGRFLIANSQGRIINYNPKYLLTLFWGVTLEPGQEYVLYQGKWYQRTLFGRLVRNGDYYIVGGTALIYYNDELIHPEFPGPANVIIARRFIP